MKLSFLLPRGAFIMLFVAAGFLRADTPAAARSNGYTVNVEIKVNEKGEPEHVALAGTEDRSPDGVLDKMALAMALKAHFPPREKDGKAVPYTVRAPFYFPIEDDEGPASDSLPKPRIKQGTATYPVYPPALRAAGVVGGAILELNVDEKGNLTHISTLRASNPEFEAAAIESVKKWQFVPALRDGAPVASRSRFGFIFDTQEKMADLKWRIVPRPKLGSITAIRPDHPITDEPAAAPPAADKPAPAAAPTAPAPASAPAK